MREIVAVCLVAVVAIGLTQSLHDTTEAIGKTAEIQARIERMQSDGTPEYEHYPTEQQDYVCNIMLRNTGFSPGESK